MNANLKILNIKVDVTYYSILIYQLCETPVWRESPCPVSMQSPIIVNVICFLSVRHVCKLVNTSDMKTYSM
ncbi:hypothetical protein C0J52_04763 [Blattella germanica]|nr:hypothetical protein C0J52_04763 [Blattella germanica]